MSDLLEFVLESVCNLAYELRLWRFSLCVIISLALTVLAHWLIHADGTRLALAIPLISGGVGAGTVWEWLAA